MGDKQLTQENTMGTISIQTRGSFPFDAVELSAEVGGHAMAIQRAITWLNMRLPAAIVKDHQLHEAGDTPPHADFGHVVDMSSPLRDGSDGD